MIITYEGVLNSFSCEEKIYILKDAVPYKVKYDNGFWEFEVPRYNICAY